MNDLEVSGSAAGGRRGFRLWHLSALVTMAGLVSGIARDPGLLILMLVAFAAVLVPITFFRGSETLDAFLGRSARGNPSPAGPLKTCIARVLALTGSGFVLVALILVMVLWR